MIPDSDFYILSNSNSNGYVELLVNSGNYSSSIFNVLLLSGNYPVNPGNRKGVYVYSSDEIEYDNHGDLNNELVYFSGKTKSSDSICINRKKSSYFKFNFKSVTMHSRVKVKIYQEI